MAALRAELPLLDAIRAAKTAGFDAVECHQPFTTPAADVRATLDETGLQMLGLNTARGDVSAGENGLAALPDRGDDARAAIDEAISYASAIGCKAVHVMAGFASGPDARETFVANLRYACEQAAPHGIIVLIEPLNRYDTPGYFLTTTAQAIDLIDTVHAPNLRLMFNCYHVQLMEGDLTHKLTNLMPHIGHIQFSSVPDRSPPNTEEGNCDHIFGVLGSLGYNKPLGAENRPNVPTDETLSWLNNC